MHTQNNECTSDCRREGCPETDGISLSPEKLSEIDTKWREESMRETIEMPCLECGAMKTCKIDSNEATGVFNVFCSDKDCEDIYASKL